jgi:hypothetical protein
MLSFIKKFQSIGNRILTNDTNYFFEQFMYGHREILLSYIKLELPHFKSSLLLKGGITHGWAPDEQIWRVRNRNLTIAPRLVWNSRNQDRALSGARNISIGAPWLYLLKILNIECGDYVSNIHSSSERPNLLMLTHNVLSTDKKIEQQAEYFNNICIGEKTTVCLFWLDFCNPEIQREFDKYGFKIECAGYPKVFDGTYQDHPGRVEFLPNILEIMSRHVNYFTDECTTSMFYAGSLGLSINIHTDRVAEIFQNQWSLQYGGDNVNFFNSGKKWLNNFFPKLLVNDATIKETVEFCWKELGSESVKNSLELSSLPWKIDHSIEGVNLEIFERKISMLKNLLIINKK